MTIEIISWLVSIKECCRTWDCPHTRRMHIQSLGWTKHFTSYKPKIIDPRMYMYFFFFEGLGGKRFMVLQNYFTYFDLNESLMLGKIKISLWKKKTHQIICTFHIYTRAIFPAFLPLRLLTFWKAPQFKLIFIQCDFQNYITASLPFTNPDFSGWVGR